MKKLFSVTALLSIVLLLVGCSKEKGIETLDYRSEVERWKEMGWSVEEILGAADQFVSVTHLKSETARATTAFWVESGARRKKRYEQDSDLFLILSFKKQDGDAFAVVMKKPKSAGLGSESRIGP